MYGTRMMRVSTLSVAMLVALSLGVTAPAGADDWEDARRDKLEEAVQNLEVEEVARARGTTPEQVREERNSLVSLRHGEVKLIADLARVDMTLEIRNTGAEVMEWRRSFALDPSAEAIGAYLQRGDERPIEAQTLTIADARRIYGEIRNPRPTRTRPGRRSPIPSGDPLRLERPSRGRLDVVVWPIAPGETVRVGLEFVSPLRGRGMRRTYVDPIRGDFGATPERGAPTVTDPDIRPVPALASIDTDWVIHPGHLHLSDVPPTGMVPAGSAGGRHRFVGPEGASTARAELPLRELRPHPQVLAVPGGGLGTRVAIWRFDPVAFLEEAGLDRVSPDCTIRLLRRKGSTKRISPWEFAVTDDPAPVTARLSPKSDTLRYAVELVNRKGDVLHHVEMDRPVNRQRLDKDRTGAITGWHRAMMAARVMAWSRGNEARQQSALDFAVDLGVLTDGTAALAVPEAERRTLNQRSRHQYWRSGAPLGAQDREADPMSPPPRSTGNR